MELLLVGQGVVEMLVLMELEGDGRQEGLHLHRKGTCKPLVSEY